VGKVSLCLIINNQAKQSIQKTLLTRYFEETKAAWIKLFSSENFKIKTCTGTKKKDCAVHTILPPPKSRYDYSLRNQDSTCWLLGTVGMLLSVPLIIILKIGFESSPEGRWLAVLLSDEESVVQEVEQVKQSKYI